MNAFPPRPTAAKLNKLNAKTERAQQILSEVRRDMEAMVHGDTRVSDATKLDSVRRGIKYLEKSIDAAMDARSYMVGAS